MMDGAELIALERRRQIKAEGFDAEHDAEYDFGCLSRAAICYAAPEPIFEKHGTADRLFFIDPWPEDWDSGEWDKRKKHSPLRRLVIAGALLAAEIDKMLAEGGE